MLVIKMYSAVWISRADVLWFCSARHCRQALFTDILHKTLQGSTSNQLEILRECTAMLPCYSFLVGCQHVGSQRPLSTSLILILSKVEFQPKCSCLVTVPTFTRIFFLLVVTSRKCNCKLNEVSKKKGKFWLLLGIFPALSVMVSNVIAWNCPLTIQIGK